MNHLEKRWDAESYDQHMHFVMTQGKSTLKILNPQPDEYILDLGCGTGDHADMLVQRGCRVVGMDFSDSMIQRAREKYPHLTFVQGDGQRFETNELFDAVFSNAALHWMKDAGGVIHSVRSSLKPGGRFAAEFGGNGNVSTITSAIKQVFQSMGLSVELPWYFPSISEYTTRLEQAGFEVVYAGLFSRPQPLNEGDNGLRIWLDTFADKLFSSFSENEKLKLYEKIENITKPSLWKEGQYVADYRRIQILAYKL